jgi:hypothetical protein
MAADDGADLGDTSALVSEPADVGAVAKARFNLATSGEGSQILRCIVRSERRSSGAGMGHLLQRVVPAIFHPSHAGRQDF